MLQRKGISFLLISFTICASVIIATRYGSGQTGGPANGTRMKVLRNKDQLHVKPTALEIASKGNKFQEGSPATQKEERELDDQIPKQLPIRIKIKQEKEKAFKDLQNEHWTRDLEIEVKNIGEKSIYYLELILDMPETRASDGNVFGFPLHYGRVGLGLFSTPLTPQDMPLKSGEVYVFRIAERFVKGWEKRSSLEENKGKAQPKKVRVIFQMLNFGDGTGFWDSAGTPFPRPKPPPGTLTSCAKPSARGTPKSRSVSWRRNAVNNSFQPPSINELPAMFLPANFLPAESLNNVSINSGSSPDLCCPSTSCDFVKKTLTRCYCSDPDLPPGVNDIPSFQSLGCSDTSGLCQSINFITISCSYPGIEFPLFCSFPLVQPCGTPPPTPTPIPTPTPTPTPCQPMNCTDPYPAIPANPCIPEQNQPGTNCPLGFTQVGNCCYPTCPSPTYASPGCPSGQTEHWDEITCTWVCLVTPPGGGGGGGGDPLGGGYYYQCNDYFWVLYEYDEVFGWIEVSSWYAGCF